MMVTTIRVVESGGQALGWQDRPLRETSEDCKWGGCKWGEGNRAYRRYIGDTMAIMTHYPPAPTRLKQINGILRTHNEIH